LNSADLNISVAISLTI